MEMNYLIHEFKNTEILTQSEEEMEFIYEAELNKRIKNRQRRNALCPNKIKNLKCFLQSYIAEYKQNNS
jgi:hypothetical protein